LNVFIEIELFNNKPRIVAYDSFFQKKWSKKGFFKDGGVEELKG